MLLLVSGWVLLPRRPTGPVTVPALFIATLSCIPFLQHVFGLVPIFGIAWIHGLYLIGFALALQTGYSWESQSRGQVADFLFLALGAAALASSAMAIYQWLGLRTDATSWILSNRFSNRYYANLAQPNLLGSLLMLGLVALAWAHWRKKLNGWLTCLVAPLLLFGVVLTGSRTALLNLMALTVLAVIWRKQLPNPRYLAAIFGLALFTLICVSGLPNINAFMGISEDRIPLEYRGLKDVRLEGWGMLFHAALEKPWFGFGWGQVAAANFSVLGRYPEQGAIWASAHNLVLDLIIWNGFPLGICIALAAAYWMLLLLRRSLSFDQILLVSACAVLGVHALLEFPLQYGYFLMPFGLIVGSLNASLALRTVFVAPWVASVFWLGVLISTAITIKDYFNAETSVYGLRFEDKGIPTAIPKTPPDVLVLTQFYESIKFARNVPKSGLSAHEIEEMRNIVLVMPSALTIQKLAANLALNGQAAEAVDWLRKSCKSSSPELCQQMEMRWAVISKANPSLLVAPWPVEFSNKK